MARTWVFQHPGQVKKHGAEGAAWCVGWLDPDGKRKSKAIGKGATGKRDANRRAEKIQSELNTGTYGDPSAKTWAAFRAQYASTVLQDMKPGTRAAAELALGHFERIIKPAKMSGIDSFSIDRYVSRRRKETVDRRKPGADEAGAPAARKGLKLVSVATINKELRTIKSALGKARRWKFLAEVPEFDFLDEPKKDPAFVSAEQFSALYEACDAATKPVDIANVSPADWWRGLLVFAYMTGWRVGEILALRWDEVDLDAGFARTLAEKNKGGRDDRAWFGPIVLDHLKTLRAAAGELVFPWSHHERTLYDAFDELQAAAGVKPAGKVHFTFHDLRRGFATANEGRVSDMALQRLMRHKSFSTTQRYVSMAQKTKDAGADLYQPVLRRKGEPS